MARRASVARRRALGTAASPCPVRRHQHGGARQPEGRKPGSEGGRARQRCRTSAGTGGRAPGRGSQATERARCQIQSGRAESGVRRAATAGETPALPGAAPSLSGRRRSAGGGRSQRSLHTSKPLSLLPELSPRTTFHNLFSPPPPRNRPGMCYHPTERTLVEKPWHCKDYLQALHRGMARAGLTAYSLRTTRAPVLPSSRLPEPSSNSSVFSVSSVRFAPARLTVRSLAMRGTRAPLAPCPRIAPGTSYLSTFLPTIRAPPPSPSARSPSRSARRLYLSFRFAPCVA
jgi:hypothetical protein